MSVRSRFTTACAGIVLSMLSANAHAALGDTVANMAMESTRFHAKFLRRNTMPLNGSSYTRNDFNLENGGTVTEFSDVTGKVFAVSWRATSMPDLGLLLGNYSAALGRAKVRARQSRVGSMHQLNAQEGDWVLISQARGRGFIGHAYLGLQLPPGFQMAELSQ